MQTPLKKNKLTLRYQYCSCTVLMDLDLVQTLSFRQVKSNQIAKIHHKSNSSLTSESNRQICLKFDLSL